MALRSITPGHDDLQVPCQRCSGDVPEFHLAVKTVGRLSIAQFHSSTVEHHDLFDVVGVGGRFEVRGFLRTSEKCQDLRLSHVNLPKYG